MTRVITKPEALEVLRAVVAAKGVDYVDAAAEAGNDCSYYDEHGAPSCIVGHVLAHLGIEEHVSEGVEARRVLEGLTTVDFAYDAIEALQRAQSAQDTGLTWGTALERAEEVPSYDF